MLHVRDQGSGLPPQRTNSLLHLLGFRVPSKEKLRLPDWCGSVGCTSSSHKPTWCQFDFRSGRMPRLWVRSPVQECKRGNRLMCLSHINVCFSPCLSPSLLCSLKENKVKAVGSGDAPYTPTLVPTNGLSTCDALRLWFTLTWRRVAMSSNSSCWCQSTILRLGLPADLE